MKSIVKGLCPPMLWNALRIAKRTALSARSIDRANGASPHTQDLDVYWSPEMSAMLEVWGESHVWQEIQLLLANCEGKVLDIACGTGRTMDFLKGFPQLELYGCDISDFLLRKASERGVSQQRLHVVDATDMKDYTENEFSYSYSIGSLEHFTEDGISAVIGESHRVSAIASFHQVPVSRDNRNHGWIKRMQSYYNNSERWWLERFQSVYKSVHVVGSGWNDDISVGKWFLGFKT